MVLSDVARFTENISRMTTYERQSSQFSLLKRQVEDKAELWYFPKAYELAISAEFLRYT